MDCIYVGSVTTRSRLSSGAYLMTVCIAFRPKQGYLYRTIVRGAGGKVIEYGEGYETRVFDAGFPMTDSGIDDDIVLPIHEQPRPNPVKSVVLCFFSTG